LVRGKVRAWLASGWEWTRNKDLVLLLLSFACVVSAWLFIALAGEVREGDTDALDKAILQAFREPNDLSNPIGSRRAEEAVRDITALGSVTILSLFSGVVIVFLLFTRRFNACLLLVAALGGGFLLNWSLKNFFNRPRPEYVTPLHYVDSHSFPSGHSLLAAVVYLTLGALVARLLPKRRQKIYVLGVAVLLTFLVGVSRVYLGVHYPSDVLAGWTVGLLWSILCWLVARQLQRRGKVEGPANAPPAPESFAQRGAGH
jgi:undecaprenyl-diphosphatase